MLTGIYSYRKVVRAFNKLGFHIVRQNKHMVMKHQITHKTVVLPKQHSNKVNSITLRTILKQAGIAIENFLELI